LGYHVNTSRLEPINRGLGDKPRDAIPFEPKIVGHFFGRSDTTACATLRHFRATRWRRSSE
jgi:hypothetical protein